MTSGAPWSVKGIDPKAREIAKDLARRSGMTLGEWLNQMILDDGAEPAAPPPSEAARRFASTSTQALSSGFPPARPPPAPTASYVERGSAARRLEIHSPQDIDVDRVMEALDQLSSRIEAAENRSTLAISGIDQSVAGVLSRIELAEREQIQVAARFEGALDETRTEQARTSERLRRMEQESVGHRSAEAMRALESALNKVAGQLYEGEARTREAIGVLRRDIDVLAHKSAAHETDSAQLVETVVARIAQRLEQAEEKTSEAMRSLEGSFAHLDIRIRATETALDRTPADNGLERLANDLSQKFDQARLDMAEQIKASADGRSDRVERSLREMAGHVQAAEKRSAQAIETMGQEVLRMADTLNQKILSAEHRSAEALDQVGGEISRVANAVDLRLKRADTAQAEALEKLGGEIARITERLAERIASAERRSALAVDDVGEQISRVTDRFNQRQERASSELFDRMRQSEERTARLLDEARDKIDRRLSGLVEPAPVSAPRSPPPAAAPAPHADPFTPASSARGGLAGSFPVGFPESPFEPAPFEPAPFEAPAADKAFSHQTFAPEAFIAAPYDASPEPEDAAPYATAAFPGEPEPPTFAIDDFEAAQPFSRGSPLFDDSELAPHEADLVPPADFDSAPTRSASTRELIAAARAAARQASQPPEPKAREAAAGGGVFGGFGRKKKDGSVVRNALLASTVVATLGIGAASYVFWRPDTVTDWSKSLSPGKADAPAPVATADSSAAPSAAPASSAAMAASLTTDLPTPPDQAAALGAAPASTANDSSDLYNQAKDKIKAKDPAGVDLLKKAANLGYAPAQFYLAKLYEDGEGGLKKDTGEARRWTQRAAANGDPKAMHNLGLYYFHGDGGNKNAALAALWFRRAADLGLVDSQYNLAQLYEQGLGVGQNPAEAYKWFLIAAKSGDGESKASAERLRAALSASAQQAAQRAAAAFRAESTAPAATDGAAALASNPSDANGAANLALAQKALAKLGYYKGPTDGAASPALRLASASYQKTLGMPTDGALNPDLVGKFTAITR